MTGLRRFTGTPEGLFLLLALVIGIAYVIWTPPLGGGVEDSHYKRVSEVATGQWLQTQSALPGGMPVFMRQCFQNLVHNRDAKQGYSLAQYAGLAAIALDKAHPGVVHASHLTFHNPASYLPQAPVMRLGLALGLSPFALLYLMRVTTLIAGALVTYAAIARMPSHRWLMAAISLLPTILFYRGILSPDPLMAGLAMLFTALVLRESLKDGSMEGRALAGLAALGLLIAQCKSGYFLLPWFALAIPRARFSSRRAWAGAVGLIVLPGMLLGVLWLNAVGNLYFHGRHYETWGGQVYPDGQLAFILHHPFAFASVLLNTLFHSLLLPMAILGFFGQIGWSNVYLPMLAYIPLILLFEQIARADCKLAQAHYGMAAKWAGALVFIGSVLLALTLLYIQWTGLHAPEVIGFQGRYLYPLAPMLVPLLRAPKKASLAHLHAKLAGLAVFGGAMGLWALAARYYIGHG
jgi:uncharacterized membrane protein